MPSRFRERLFQTAISGVVDARRGTPYPCSQRDIDAAGHFSDHNERPFVSAGGANRELIEHNDQRRPPPSRERDAIRRLSSLMDDLRAERYPWGPDLVIKTFTDLDIVFFGGVLRGNVEAGWGKADNWVAMEYLVPRGTLGITIPVRTGRAQIFLNAKAILLDPFAYSPFRAMFTTMLHEMCHAFEFVRVRRGEWDRGSDGHGPNFGSKIHAVHRRAKDLAWTRSNRGW